MTSPHQVAPQSPGASPRPVAEQKDRFLEAYRRVGSVRAAARAVGARDSSAAEWLRRDPDFARRCQEAREAFLASLSPEDRVRYERKMASARKGAASPKRASVLAQKRAFLQGVRDFGTVRAGRQAAAVTRERAMAWLQQKRFQQWYQNAVEDFKDSLDEELVQRIRTTQRDDLLKFKAKGERPEKYDPRSKKSQADPNAIPDWDALERKALEYGDLD